MNRDERVPAPSRSITGAIEARIAHCQSRVIEAERQGKETPEAKVNSAYHGGEIAGLTFAASLLRDGEA